MNNTQNEDIGRAGLQAWLDMVSDHDAARLPQMLAENATFHSPVVHRAQVGKQLTAAYLAAAMAILDNGSFNYVRTLVTGRDAVLEFEVQIDGIQVNGVDMIRWNENGQIEDFKVMLRPLKAVNLVHQLMAAALQSA